ncbi:hypothetical protein KFE25_003515 [Diacronema lutheri]|uniref:TNase-like domain-containing protein n=2 Tax=Diacronema lutheri TaxID=2081491 RepID=A0A8J6C7F7_DIALT|nr:hypothetical protein KFE25_003515 [Diacronema lutheri]
MRTASALLAAGLLAHHIASPAHAPQLLLRPPLASAAVPARISEDRVVRVLDANAVKLEKSGVVRLAGASTPTVGGLPECFRFTPSAHLRRALPKGARVQVRVTDSARRLAVVTPHGRAGGAAAPSVNEALVTGGWARATRVGVDDDALAEALERAQASARASRVGLWVACDASHSPVEAVYEEVRAAPAVQPVDVTLGEGDAPRTAASTPAALRGQFAVSRARAADRCGEYVFFEDAKRAYDAAPARLARLDSDGDGVPCGGLPHRPEIERRQLKAPVRPRPSSPAPSGSA